MVSSIIKKLFESSDIDVLGDSTMTFPTWDCFKDWIDEASCPNFPSSKFGNQPIHNENNTLIPINAKPSLASIIQGKEFVGIDVPVLLEPKENKNGKTIIIVGESPLRETDENNNKEKILLGTPYAIHQKFDSPSQCNVYKKILNDLLRVGYSIYLTDIVKIWWKDTKLKYEEDYKTIFGKELEELEKLGIQNSVIVAWGNSASGKLSKMLSKKGKEFLKQPHPSRNGWIHWKLRIFEKAVYVEKKIEYATQRFPEKRNPTTEVIVANEVVKEILEYCRLTKAS
jgi:hypothetical protein